MKATIEKHGKFDYRWTVGRTRGYASTRFGAIRGAKKQAESFRKWKSAKQNAEIIEV
jgi:hypothetical protein